MPASAKGRNLEAEVAGLSSRVDAVQESLEKNNEVTEGLRDDVTRLRTEMNGHLPRIDRNVERIFEKLDEDQGVIAACHEQAAVHGHEIGALFNALSSKAGKAANDEAHARLWLMLRLSVLAIAMAAVGVLVARALGL